MEPHQATQSFPRLDVSEKRQSIYGGFAQPSNPINGWSLGDEAFQQMKLLICGPVSRRIRLVTKSQSGGGEGLPAPVADSGDNGPVGGDPARNASCVRPVQSVA